VKNGLGTLVLGNAANAFNGTVTVNGGVLQVGGDGALGVAPTSFVANAITLNNGGGFGTSANTILGVTRGVTLNGGGVLSPNSGTTLTIVTPVTGTGGLAHTGAGTTILGGNNTFTGGISVSAGILVLGGTNTITGPIYVTNGTLAVANGPGTINHQHVTFDNGTLGLYYDGDGTGNPETYNFPTIDATFTG